MTHIPQDLHNAFPGDAETLRRLKVEDAHFQTLAERFEALDDETRRIDDGLEAAMRDLSIRMNKAVVQQQIDDQKKKLEKLTGKTENAVKAQDKTQGKLNKAQKKMEKISKEKVDLQNQHNILEKDIALQNERWTTSQDPKDLKKLTKARTKITKNESKLASALKDESKTQADIAKYTAAVPDATKVREAKATDQAEVQRTVDALQRKLEAVR